MKHKHGCSIQADVDAAGIKPINTCKVAETPEGEGHAGTGLPSGGGPSLAGQPAFPWRLQGQFMALPIREVMPLP